ncbi:MAG: hypothetical protein SGJ10_01870 [Bacteroidota bacterium]|nr:hypothetical protein [Bacteroidota bacterium]
MPRFIWFFVLILFASPALAQTEDDDLQQQQQLIERLTENQSTNADVNEWTEQLRQFAQNKIELNHCTRQQLEQLGLLSDVQINNFLQHRVKFGNLISILELQVIPGFAVATIKSIQPFVMVQKDWLPQGGNWKSILSSGSHQLNWLNQMQPEQNEGQRRRVVGDTIGRSYYPGSPLHSVFRYRYSYSDKISISYLGEKDAGEQFGRGINKQGFDFNSGHIMIGGFKHLQKWVIGDFNITLGQGLTIGSGLAFGKSAMVLNLKRNYSGIRPYRSVNENEFMRGTAITLKYGNWWVTAFAARQHLDGSANQDTFASDEGSIAGLVSTGFHRTASELAGKDILLRNAAGGNLTYKTNNFQIGLNICYINYGQAFVPQKKPYNLYKFQGTNNLKFGTDYRYTRRNYTFFGELSMNQNGALSGYHVFLISLTNKLDAAIMMRHYAKDYQPLLSNAIGENTNNENEQGLYTGWIYKLGRGFTLNSYIDFYRYPWITYTADVPNSYGMDHLSQLDYQVSKKISMYIRYKYKMGQLNANTGSAFSELEQQGKENFRFNLSMTTLGQIELHSRVEASLYTHTNQSNEKGVIAYQDIEKRWRKLQVTLRVAFFNTPGYNSRIYAYENELPFAYSIIPFYATGTRYYIMARWHHSKNFDIYARLAQTYYSDQTDIGSGLDLIKSNHKTDAKMMLSWRIQGHPPTNLARR